MRTNLIALKFERPDFRIAPVLSGNDLIPIIEEKVHVTPFASLVHFRKQMEAPQPKVLIVAPLSGHFATLLRGTVTARDGKSPAA